MFILFLLQGEAQNKVFAEKLETLLHRAYHLQEDFGSSIPADNVLADFGKNFCVTLSDSINIINQRSYIWTLGSLPLSVLRAKHVCFLSGSGTYFVLFLWQKVKER